MNIKLPSKLALAVAVLGTVTVLWLARPPSTRPVLQAFKEELVLREGKLYRTNSTKPFSGFMLERYRERELMSRSAVENGLFHGLSEGFYTNAQVQVREHFVHGFSNGVRTKWYPSGAKWSETQIVNGKLQGSFRRWHETGALAEEVMMEEGQPNGPSISYYPNGSVKAEALLDHGKVRQSKYWKEGERLLVAKSERQ
ncbi:MAG TPA: toxin-antitoxin system YwqK family antitoxin [Verrucomicrobiae bacterium]|nr:toxin-antitoxin system YwqK family antitoxin [Verrucomicrobiae bacterium]